MPPSGSPPVVLGLDQNFPNPFNPMTNIRYTLGKQGQAKITIFDVSGRMVRELTDGMKPAGSHVAMWDGLDANGQPMPSGTYFYRLEAPDFEATRSMVLVK